MRTTFVTITFTLLLTACAPYVNIPPQQGDVAFHSPNGKTVRRVMNAALQHVLADRPINQPFQIILPEGTDPKVYGEALAGLGENARYSSDGTSKSDYPIMTVTQVRIRGSAAEVDIVRPQFTTAPVSSPQVVTVYLRYNVMDKWHVTRMKEWRGNPSRTADPGQAPPAAPAPSE